MPTSYTRETKSTTSYTKEPKPGVVDVDLTWNEATEMWTVVGGTWDAPMSIAATVFTKETKP